MRIQVCPICNKEFTSHRKNVVQTFCSAICSLRNRKKIAKANYAFREELGVGVRPLAKTPRKWEIHKRTIDKINP